MQPDRPDTPRRDLAPLLHARSVCLVGASGDPSRLTGQPLQILLRHGFDGEIVCVNPKYKSILGRTCYPSISELPEASDVALIMLPAPLVPDALRECGRKGIKGAVILSAGFEETQSGRGLGAALDRYASEYGMTVVGPNSEGLWSIPARLLLTHGTAAQREGLVPGGVTVLSQSGSIGAAIMRSLQDAGVGCRYFISVGNETNLTLTDCFEWMVSDGSSRVILLFIEGVRDGERLVSAARRAAAAGIAIAALKAGSSESGRAATASHTGKIASSERVYSSVFRQAGILEVSSLSHLLEAGEVLSLKPTRFGAGGVGIVSASGGCRALLADAADRQSVPLATFTSRTTRELSRITSGAGVVSNPIDVPVDALYDIERFSTLVRAVAADPEVDSLVIQYANRGVRQVFDHIELLGEIANSRQKPVVVSFLGDLPPSDARAELLPRGVLCAREPDQAVRYLSWLRHRAAAEGLPMKPSGRTVEHVAAAMSWEEQISFLARCGIGVPPWRRVAAGADPISATRGLRFPVVVKAFPQDADHKTEAGLVRVGIKDGDGLREAVAAIRDRLPVNATTLIQEAVVGVEAVLGAREDPDFGPVLVIGTGGSRIEWLSDVAYLSLPEDEHGIARAIDDLRLAELLAPFRGQPAADRDALVASARRLGDMFLTSSALREIEVNPLFVRAKGSGVIAADVLMK